MKEKILIDQLKKQMKSKGITYNQIAKALDISLSTVKRDFALKNLSLSRFLSICEITNISLKDLSQSIEVSQPKTHILTDEQEAFFAKNINYWAYFDQLLSRRSPSFLSQKYKITKNQEVKYLKKLDALKLIEWGPGNKVKILVEDVSWNENGKLREKFLEINERQFLGSRFKGESELYSFFVEDIPKSAIPRVIQEMKKVENLIELEHQMGKYTKEKRKSCGVMFALRPWNFNPLEELSIK